MEENKFRVYCEFEINGELHKSMESPASWFLLTQTGELWSYDPGEAPRPLEKEYTKAIPLFYTGFRDLDCNEIYKGDLIQNESGRICEVGWNKECGRWDAYVKRTVKNDNANGFSPKEWHRFVRIIGNIYENLEF